jgi:hypothetical protein
MAMGTTAFTTGRDRRSWIQPATLWPVVLCLVFPSAPGPLAAAGGPAREPRVAGAGVEDVLLAQKCPGIGSPGDLQRLGDSRLVMSFDKAWGVYGRCSEDLGKTWMHERTIAGDPAEVYGYPGVEFAGEMALIGYSSRAGAHLARIGIDRFYGK